MAFKIVFPQLDVNIEEGTIGEWLKQEGDPVAENEPLVEIITDKATFEYESPHAGRLLKIVAKPKSTVPVGYVLAVVGEPGEAIPNVEETNAAVLEAYRAKHGRRELRRDRRRGNRVRVRATPAARKLARAAGIDLANLPPKSDGPIEEDDVRRYIEEQRG